MSTVHSALVVVGLAVAMGCSEKSRGTADVQGKPESRVSQAGLPAEAQRAPRSDGTRPKARHVEPPTPDEQTGHPRVAPKTKPVSSATSAQGTHASTEPQATSKVDKIEVEFRTQEGHANGVTSACFAPDGKRVLSASEDGTVKLWDTATGRLVRTFVSRPGWLGPVRFSPDGHRALLVNGQRFWTWDILSGKLVQSLRCRGMGGEHVYLSHNGQSMLVGRPDRKVDLWDVTQGTLVRTFEGHSKRISAVCLSPDATKALSASEDRSVKLWDVATGRLIHTLSCEPPAPVRSVCFSPDGAQALVASLKSMWLWDVASGRPTKTFRVPRQAGLTQSPSDVCFSADGKRLLAGSRAGTLALWELGTGGLVGVLDGHCSSEREERLDSAITSVCSSPDGNFALTGSEDRTLRLWDISTGRPMRTFGGPRRLMYGSRLSPDGTTVLGIGGDRLRLWDLTTCRLARTLRRADQWPLRQACFGPHGMSALSDGRGGLDLWDLQDGRVVRTLTMPGHRNCLYALCSSPDGNSAVSGYLEGKLAFWDLITGRLICAIEAHKGPITSARFSPDGRLVLSGSDLGSHGRNVQADRLKLWDVATGQLVHNFGGYSTPVTSVCFSPDGTQAMSLPARIVQPKGTAPWGNLIKLWDVATGRCVQTLVGRWFSLSGSACFSLDGTHALTGWSDQTLKLWDLNLGKVIRTFRGHTGNVTDVHFCNGEQALSGSKDGTIRLWDVASGREIAVFMAGEVDGNEEWIVYTPDGYFDASRRGGSLLHAVQGLQVIGIDQLALRNNRPDIILRRLGSKDQGLIDHFHARYERRIRRAGLTEEQLLSDYYVPEARILEARQQGKFVDIRFELVDRKHGLSRYSLYVNDVPLFGAYGKPVRGRTVSLTERVELTRGANKIELTCMNVVGVEAWRAMTLADYDQEVRADLYFIGFGVSQYRDAKLNLRYAHRDAQDLARLFAGLKGKYRDVHIKTFVDEDVTVENIKKAKAFLRDARVDDTFVLFIAGHGMYERTGEATYYFLTHRADPLNLSGTAADFTVIEDLLQRIAPRQKLFLMDTCESGELEGETQSRFVVMAQTRGVRLRTARGPGGIALAGASQTKARSWLHYRERYIYNDLLRRSGAIVFSSCKGGEMSCESDKVQNGLFTEAIIQGLTSDAADRDRSKVVSIAELREYVSEAVSRWTAGCQNPTVDRDNIQIRFGLPLAAKQ